MSLQFNDTTNFKGLVQMYENEIGATRGDIANNANKLKEFAAEVNVAFDDYITLAFKASGTWQFDDSNHEKYPFIRTNLISGQRDYTFLTDEQSNLILDIFKVVLLDPSGKGKELTPIDAQSSDRSQYNQEASNFYNGQAATGIPQTYDKTANGIQLGLIPNYSYPLGLELYINREPSYFTYTDTTKKPGVPGNHHKYFYLKPALQYARRNNLASTSRLELEVMKMEGDEDRGITGVIARDFGRRERDIKRRVVANVENTR